MTTIAPFSNPTTSLAGARACAGSCDSDREMIFTYLVSCGLQGATMDQIHDNTGIKTSTICARLSELRGITYGDDGRARTWPVRVVVSDQRRESNAGVMVKVFVAVNP
jgi:hypothetical protein